MHWLVDMRLAAFYPAFPFCRYTTGNAPANRQMLIVSVVRGYCKKKKNRQITLRILVDTNILINLEDNRIIDKEFSTFYNLAISNNCKILYHPSAIPEDIQRDKNDERRNIILSKLAKYEKLESPATLSPDFLAEIP